MKTKVVNCKKEKYDVYIGRPSPFGNPFIIGRDGDRKKVINLFHSYFYNRLDYDIDFKIKIKELKGKTLGCYCKPLDCHGDIIAEYLNKNE
jgi:hypothetical protein